MSLETILNNGPDLGKLTGVESEHMLLSALIAKNDLYEHVFKILKPEYFCHHVHRELYKKISHLLDAGQTSDEITLKNYFEIDDIFKDLGGVDYLVALSKCLTTTVPSQCIHYAKKIKNLYLKRKLIQFHQEQISHVFGDPDADAFEDIEDAQQGLFKLKEDGVLEDANPSLESIDREVLRDIEKAFKEDGNSDDLMSHFSEIDKMIEGFNPGDLIIIAGRPSMGKSSLGLNIARNIAQASLSGQQGGGAVGFFSIEMSAKSLYMRLLSEEAGLPSNQIKRGRFEASDFDKILCASRTTRKLPLEIFENDLSLAAIRMSARQMKRKLGLDIIIIDYLQLIKSAEDSHHQNRTQEITTITAGLKALAKELKVPIIALSQLSRQTEGRENKRPQLSDLRDSGSIEQDADIVGFVYREEYYASRNRPSDDDFKALTEWKLNMNQIKDKAEFIIAKNRSGKTGTANLCFDASLTKFSDGDVK